MQEQLKEAFEVSVNVKEDDVLQNGEVMLVEWQDVPKVKQILSIDDKPMDVFGMKPNRIISADHKIVCQYFADEDTIDFTPMNGKEGTFLVSVSAPSKECSDYHWFCQRLGAFIDEKNLHVVFGRICTAEESEFLDGKFPHWREEIKTITEGENK
jgi:hypothetical protein